METKLKSFLSNRKNLKLGVAKSKMTATAKSQTELCVESKGTQYDAEIGNIPLLMFPRSTQTEERQLKSKDFSTQTVLCPIELDLIKVQPDNAVTSQTNKFLLPTLISGTLLALAGIYYSTLSLIKTYKTMSTTIPCH